MLKKILSPARTWLMTAAIASVILSSCRSNPVANEPTLLPAPARMEVSEGTYLLKDNAAIGYADKALKPAVDYLQTLLSTPTGYTLPVSQGSGDLQLALTDEGKPGSYVLNITPQSVRIEGNGYGGVIAGISTLRQLFAKEIESKATVASSAGWALPCVSIADAPRFEWRGIMLDVSRHFFSKEEVKELLDVMALYKLNKFHWHLTDDQGWRIEIKKYPLLTQKGAWRTWNNHDRQCKQLARKEDNTDFNIPAEKLRITEKDTLYGGFYTQEDIREVVSYAATRGIDVIPEIDMPGHFLEAISLYPGISCFEQIGWGETFSSPICPGKEYALEFCKDVYREIFGLFPYHYVHVGGDEVEKANWKKCPDCQRRMRRNGLKNEKELHSWFIRYMEKFFNENGKQMIGWDEILEGGLSETATVMWWRSWQPNTVEATTTQGNKVICCPNAQFYLDYKQDKKSLRNIYDYPLLPQSLSPQQQALVMGVQGNLWAEQIPSRERMLYLAFPRLLAIAELAWSQPEQMNWDDFFQRTLTHFRRLDALNINYRIPDLEGFYDSNVFIGRGEVNVSCADPSAVIRYTTDGSIPTRESARYDAPITVTKTTDFIFRTFRPNGKGEEFVKARFIKDEYAPAVAEEASASGTSKSDASKSDVSESDVSGASAKAGFKPGLSAVWHEYRGESCAGIESAPVNGTYEVPEVSIPQGVKGNIGLVITGFIRVPEDDIYTFRLMSDDGSTLVIDQRMIIDNDGPHSPREMIGQHAMKAGLHPIEVKYFDYNGGVLEMKVFDSNHEEVKELQFVH